MLFFVPQLGGGLGRGKRKHGELHARADDVQGFASGGEFASSREAGRRLAKPQRESGVLLFRLPNKSLLSS